jgi:hypothetical protein
MFVSEPLLEVSKGEWFVGVQQLGRNGCARPMAGESAA